MTELLPTYELTFEKRPGYLYALVRSDKTTLEMAKEYLRRTAEMCDSVSCGHLLLERDVPTMLSAVDLYFTTLYFLDLMNGKKIAFVNPHDAIHDHLEYAFLSGTRAGGHYRLFHTFPEAEKWLLKGQIRDVPPIN